MNEDYRLNQKVKDKTGRRGTVIHIFPAVYSYSGVRTISSTKYVVQWEDGTKSEPLQKSELEAT